MADDKKQKKNEVPDEVVEAQEPARGPNGEVGKPTASLTIKQLWHAEHHVLMDVGDKNNPRKQEWVKRTGAPSLRKYARQLAASGNTVAKDWFEHKAGSLNAQRTEKNTSRIALEAQASMAARRKKSQGKQSKAADAAAPVKAK